MRDFPNNDDDGSGEGDGPANAMILHLDDDGLPCFNCFFGALYDALPHLPIDPKMAEIDPDLDEDSADFMAHFVTTSACLAERIIGLAEEQFGESADTMVEGFIEYLQRMLAKRNQAPAGRLN